MIVNNQFQLDTFITLLGEFISSEFYGFDKPSEYAVRNAPKPDGTDFPYYVVLNIQAQSGSIIIAPTYYPVYASGIRDTKEFLAYVGGVHSV